MSNPDFIHTINNNRFRNASNTSSQKTTTRAYMNDNITLRFDNDTVSTVPRFRLDKKFIQSAVNRVTTRRAASKPKEVKSHLFSTKECTKDTATKQSSRPPSLMFSHLHQRESNTIIMSDDAELKTKCSVNVTYDVVAMPAIAINDGGVLSFGGNRSSRSLKMSSSATSYHTETHYDGDLLFIVHGVPTSSQNGAYDVTENDVKNWLVSGAIASLEQVDVLTKKIKSLKEKLMQIQQEVASLPPSSVPSGKGRVSIGSSVNNSRDKKAKVLLIEKERCNSLLQTATQSLETLYSQHVEDCKLTVEKRKRDGAFDNKVCDWAIIVGGDKKTMYTSLIEKNKNWSIVPMYVFGTKGSKHPVSLPIPEEDQSHHFVDIRGVTLTKLPSGFGIFESYEEFDRGNSRSRHRLYHGQFHEGAFSEGSLYTDAGIFSGKFDKGYPIEGTMQYADGVKISGKFAVEDVSSQIGKNPYCRGLPDGFQIIKFPDKTTYEGEMKQGRITGKGTYKDAGLELSGEFKDGVLQSDGGKEGHGYSNLHLSLMYGGERLWGPTSTNQAQRKK